MPQLRSLDALTAKTLYVFLPGYSAPREGEPFSDAGPLLNCFANRLARRRTQPFREHVRMHRDYYANPRAPAYMINAAGELIEKSTVDRAVMIVGNDVAVEPSDIPWVEEFKVVSGSLARGIRAGLNVTPQAGDAALLLHSDALGLGLSGLEMQLLAHGFDRVAVLNGRRRCYQLDLSLRGLLGRHRFLSETRILESVLAGLAVCLGFVFSVSDRLSGKGVR